MLNPNIIIPFDGNHADVPVGFSRETTLDSKFPKGADAGNDPGDTGGNATHEHTSPTHTHSLSSHTHTFTVNAWSKGEFQGATTSPTDNVQDLHSHTGTSNANTATSGATAVTYGAFSNNPPYYEVIFIKSTSYNFIPVNGMILNKATTRTGLDFHTDSAGKYLRGAGTGENAGGTGGTTTNTHSINHTHTGASHAHTATSGGASPVNRHKRPSGASNYMLNHVHSFTLDSASPAPDAYSGNLVTTETVEPAYTTLNVYKNTSASSVMPKVGDVAMWLGTLATIPIGWVLCDGSNDTVDMRSRFFKATSTATTSSTGGSNTHTHSAQSHTHTGGTHNHTAPNQGDGTGAGNTDGDNTGEGVSKLGGQHTVTIANATSTFASATTTADSSDNQPEYVTVVYIQLKFISGGGFLLNMI